MMNELVNSLRNAKHILFVTGSGISTASGLPTYRGSKGLYTNNFIPPELRMSEAVFKWAPALTWSHLNKVYRASRDIKPNAAHVQIAKIAAFIPEVTVLTQNVDGLHQDAGSKNVIEIHGSGRSLICTHCDWRNENPDLANLPNLPRCPNCGKVVRPPVVLFGGKLPGKALAQMRAMYTVEPDVVIAIGTTALFPYILQPFERAVQLNKTTVVIDPEPAEHLAELCQYVIKDPAEKVLPPLFKEVVRGFNSVPKASAGEFQSPAL